MLTKRNHYRPIPEGAQIITRKGRQYARWTNGQGKTHTRPVNDKGDRIVCESRQWYVRLKASPTASRAKTSSGGRGGEELKSNLASVGIDWWNTSDYVALPYWRPSVLAKAPPEYDLVCTYHRSILLAQANTVNNPYCIEGLEQEAYITKVRINPETAGKKGIRNGDYIYIESQVGKIRAQAALSEGIHPDVIAIGGAFGQWATPLAKDRDWVSINALSPISFDHTDPLSGSMEGHGVAVKVYKA